MPVFEGKPAESFDFKEIIYEKKDWVARVTINRPQAYNCYSTRTLQELTLAFQDCSYDDGVAVVVVTGAGDKAFCTGGDVDEYAGDYTARPRDYWKWGQVFVEMHNKLRNIGKPSIARLNGIVAGGGNELNLSCDLAIAADHVTIRQVGTKVGSVAAGGATQFLPIVIGDRRAREMLLTCRPITAQQALEWGLVNRVVPYAELDKAVDELCQELIPKFAECARYTKTQLNFWKDMAWGQTIGHAMDWLAVHFTSWEPWEGMKSFVEKRPTDYMKLRQLAADGKSSEFMWGPYTQQCPSCGTRSLPSEFKHCGQCGAKIKD